MPLPRSLGRFNRRVTNRLLAPLLLRLPGFGTVIHVGRRSRATRRTPVLAFRAADRVTFALTYGPQADWARNVVAAGRCEFETRAEKLALVKPRLYRDGRRTAVPRPVRFGLRALGAADFLELRVAPEGAIDPSNG